MHISCNAFRLCPTGRRFYVLTATDIKRIEEGWSTMQVDSVIKQLCQTVRKLYRMQPPAPADVYQRGAEDMQAAANGALVKTAAEAVRFGNEPLKAISAAAGRVKKLEVTPGEDLLLWLGELSEAQEALGDIAGLVKADGHPQKIVKAVRELVIRNKQGIHGIDQDGRAFLADLVTLPVAEVADDQGDEWAPTVITFGLKPLERGTERYAKYVLDCVGTGSAWDHRPRKASNNDHGEE